MISLNCTNCRTTLTIDDAFAGGVCRCQHCGTIQTVPSHLKRTSRAAAPGQAPGSAVIAANDLGEPLPGQKALYKRRARTDSTSGLSGLAGAAEEGTGLEDLADVVVSGSGIGSDRLRNSNPGRAAAVTKPKSKTPLFVAGGAVLAILAAAGAWFALTRGSHRGSAAPTMAVTAPGPEVFETATVNTNGPNFCGVKLDEPSVIYVLDRGNATREVFDTLKEVTYKSIQSLGTDRKFQVIFWNNGSGATAYPEGSPAFARPETLSVCRRVMEDTTAFGQSDATAALEKALANHPGAIVLATGKALDLDDSFADSVVKMRGGTRATKVHTIALGESESHILKEIAARTSGEYKTVSAATLRQYAQ